MLEKDLGESGRFKREVLWAEKCVESESVMMD